MNDVTLRDYMAGIAMAHFLTVIYEYPDVALQSYAMADAMIAQSKVEPNDDRGDQ